MKAPGNIQERVDELGFEICGWDEVSGALSGHGQMFIGSHEEIAAYLQAWDACRKVTVEKAAEEAERANPRVERSLLCLRSEPLTLNQGVSYVVARPQIPFRGDRVAIPDDVAPHFDVLDVRVGTRSVLTRSETISADLFAARLNRGAMLRLLEEGRGGPIAVQISSAAEAEFGRALSFPTCQAAEEIVMAIVLKRMVDDPPRVFEAMVLGQTVRWRP